jgi:hypothetical protein
VEELVESGSEVDAFGLSDESDTARGVVEDWEGLGSGSIHPHLDKLYQFIVRGLVSLEVKLGAFHVGREGAIIQTHDDTSSIDVLGLLYPRRVLVPSCPCTYEISGQFLPF